MRQGPNPWLLQPGNQQLALEDEFLGQVGIQLEEEFILHDELAMPLHAVDLLDLSEALGSDVLLDALHVEVLILRNPADGGLESVCAEAATLDDPLEHAHVVTEAGPHELAIGILAEPVDVEDTGQVLDLAAHLEPMGEVISHVVAAEGQHGHGVATHLADRAGGGRSHLGTDGGTEVHAVNPVKGLEDQRHGGGAASAEDHGADAHTRGIFPVGVDDRTIAGRSGEAAVWVAAEDGFALCILLAGGPVLAFPVDEMGGSFLGHAFPPHITIVGQRDIRKDGVAKDGIHGHGVAVVGGAGSNAEETGFGVDGVEIAIGAGLDPGDVVADTGDFPSFLLDLRRRDEHGEVCLAAGAGEGGGDVALFPLGVFDGEDEHVLGHPALVASHGGGDAQGEALLAQEGVATVSGAEAHDEALFGEVGDVGILRIARPGDVLASVERIADRVQALDEGLGAIELVVHLGSHAGHDAHVGHDVRTVADLDAVLGDGRSDGAHAEGDDVQGTALHTAFEEAVELGLHDAGVFPVIGRAGVLGRAGANEGALLDTGDVAGVAANEQRIGAFFGIEPETCAGVHDQLAHELVFFF